ncbi:MAG: hypothetical protein ACTHU0_21170 [Kofleriaceae bacterium]
MELKPGYRQSDLGVLPNEWELVPFSKLLEFRNGINADKAAYGTGVRFINVLEVITRSHLRASDIPGRISLPVRTLASYQVRRGDVLFNRTSETQEEVGLAAVYSDDEEVVFGGFNLRVGPAVAMPRSVSPASVLVTADPLRNRPVSTTAPHAKGTGGCSQLIRSDARCMDASR